MRRAASASAALSHDVMGRICDNRGRFATSSSFACPRRFLKLLRGKDTILTKPSSRVKAALITTNEELVIAQDTMHIVTENNQ